MTATGLVALLVIGLIDCWSYALAELIINTSNATTKYSNESSLELINDITTHATNIKLSNGTFIESSNTHIERSNLPNDCSQREKLKLQPINDRNSRLKKCCPIGESLNLFKENQSDQLCGASNHNHLNPHVINAVLYDNCIEDIETDILLPLDIGNPCNTSFLYNNADDLFYVLQDGSLLIMDEFANDTYTVEKRYCLDFDNISGVTYAVICITSVEEHLKRSQIVIVAILMLMSIPCLLFVCYLHLTIKELRTLHGLSLSCMSLCLATGYFLHSLVHIFNLESMNIGYAAQFSILSYFFWFFCLCCNVFFNIWFKIPLNKKSTKFFIYCNFTVYLLISVVSPLVFVILTIQKGLPGMPSYFIRGFTESIRESQRYFIPPVSSLLFMSFLIMVGAFFGFQRVKKMIITSKPKEGATYINIHPDIDQEKHEQVKKDAKCISFFGIIMIATWLLEIVTFYSPGPESYFIFMEMINGLQGVLLLLIFLLVRRKRTLVLRWWYDRGSHNVDNMELAAINK